jgi:hypothetical protein
MKPLRFKWTQHEILLAAEFWKDKLNNRLRILSGDFSEVIREFKRIRRKARFCRE